LKSFVNYFTFEKLYSKIHHDLYTWNDLVYSDFMNEILRKIVPRKEEANTILFKELDDFTSVFFF